MKNFTFPEKNQLRAWPICWIGRALYAKTSHHYLCRLGMLGVLSSSRVFANSFVSAYTVSI